MPRRLPSSTNRRRSASPKRPPFQGGAHRPPGHVGEDRAGGRVLVNGAGGGTGAFAVQMAKAAGAEVTGVDNGMKQEFMRSLGTDHVLDYTRVDSTKTDTRYDLILDLVCERSMFAIRRALAPGSRHTVSAAPCVHCYRRDRGTTPIDRRPKNRGAHGAAQQKAALLLVADMVAAGTLRATVERTYLLDGVPEALDHLGEGHALGKLVIGIG